jgi:predicted 3-demethylubiquinone-9 3-methyltransferase (glyoxalase superfamily)
MQKITPMLWFDGNAEEAVQFYLSVFKTGKSTRRRGFRRARRETTSPAPS